MTKRWKIIGQITILTIAMFYNYHQGFKRGEEAGYKQSGAIMAKFLSDTETKEKFETWVKHIKEEKKWDSSVVSGE